MWKGIVNLLCPLAVWQGCGMDTPSATKKYKNHRFPVEIISYAVWLYFRFCLSFRDVEKLWFERGVFGTDEEIPSGVASLVDTLPISSVGGVPGRGHVALG